MNYKIRLKIKVSDLKPNMGRGVLPYQLGVVLVDLIFRYPIQCLYWLGN